MIIKTENKIIVDSWICSLVVAVDGFSLPLCDRWNYL